MGCVVVDPHDNVVLLDGYNGLPRGFDGPLCGGIRCLRDRIESGTELDIGCHHAERNAIANAARLGIALDKSWMFVTGEPCIGCAKMVHHSGIAVVYCVKHGYAGGHDGVEYLEKHGVEVRFVDGPRDPRLANME